MGRIPAKHTGGSSPGDGDSGGGGDEPGDDGGPPNKGEGGTTGSEGGGDGNPGNPGGDTGRSPVVVRSRAFSRDANGSVYALTVHPPQPRPYGEVFLHVAAIGDDAMPNPVRIRMARLASNRRLSVPQLGRIGPVAFPKTGPLRLDVTLSEPRRLSLQITAEEGANDASQ